MGGDGGEDRSTMEDVSPTMEDVSHTNPYTGATVGELFRRGPAVADGGTEPAPADAARVHEERASMGDVDHTPRNGTESEVNDVWVRGDHGSDVETGEER